MKNQSFNFVGSCKVTWFKSTFIDFITTFLFALTLLKIRLSWVLVFIDSDNGISEKDGIDIFANDVKFELNLFTGY